ncbi:MAG: hypothetical protein ACYCT1_19480 [Steroidobacteraceae bacterium]
MADGALRLCPGRRRSRTLEPRPAAPTPPASRFLKRCHARADYGLHWPRGKRHFLSALLWSLALAIAVNAGTSALDVLLHLKQTTGDILGVLYAYWLEDSQNIVAPILAHKASDGITVVFWALGIFPN